MKITRKGCLPQEVWMGRCPYCFTEIQAEKEELKIDDDASREEDEEIRWAPCMLPGCSTRVLFRKKVVP